MMTHRFKVAFLTGSVLVALAVGASTLPSCQRFVSTYTKKLVKNTVSKETQAKWAAWNKTHPNFKPKSRLKYKMTTEEIQQKLAFACQVPTKPVEVSIDLEPMPIEDLLTTVAMVEPPTDLFAPTPTLTDLDSVPSTPTDLEVAYSPLGYPGSLLPGMPIGGIPSNPPVSLPPVTPPNIAQTPEPTSLVLSFTGIAFLAFIQLKRNKEVA